MKYKILYLPIAERDILRISDAMSDNPGGAKRLLGEIEGSLKLLEFMPCMWPQFAPRPEFWQMDLENHILLYTVDENQRKVIVYRVLPEKGEADEQVSRAKSQGGPSLRVVDIEAAKNLSARELIEAEGE